MKRLNSEERERLLETLLQEVPLKKTARTLFIDPGTSRSPDKQGVTWYRFAYQGQAASAWIPTGPFDRIFIRIPKDRESILLLIHAAASELAPQGSIFFYGMNDEGMRSISEKLETVFTQVETICTKHHARIVEAKSISPSASLKKALDDWKILVDIPLGQTTAALVSYPGTFAHGHLDPGTKLLLAHLPELAPKSRVLDFGCGIGILSAALLHQDPSLLIDMVDIFAPAVAAAKQNVPGAEGYLGDGLTCAKGKTYHLILSNPPVHTQREQTLKLLRTLLETGKTLLVPGGEIRFVVQTTTPVLPLLKELSVHGHIVASDSTYTIWRVGRR